MLLQYNSQSLLVGSHCYIQSHFPNVLWKFRGRIFCVASITLVALRDHYSLFLQHFFGYFQVPIWIFRRTRKIQLNL